jgi:hypothetical protein
MNAVFTAGLVIVSDSSLRVGRGRTGGRADRDHTKSLESEIKYTDLIDVTTCAQAQSRTLACAVKLFLYAQLRQHLDFVEDWTHAIWRRGLYR